MSIDGTTRRDVLARVGGGIGVGALAWLLERDARAVTHAKPQAAGGVLGRPHHRGRAKRVVHIFCCGGVSHLDTFDYKPELENQHGKELTTKGKLDPFFGKPGRLMKSPFAFQRHGQSGQWVSDLLPKLALCVDDICFIKSMVAKNNNHTPATFQANTGFTMNGFPAMGAWISYGLGSVNDELPAYVVLPDPRGLPAGGSINWQAGFLPATHQGTAFRTGYRGGPAGDASEPIVDLRTPGDVDPAARKAGMKLLDRMNRRHPAVLAEDDALDLLREADRVTRYLEDLDLARERIVVLQEELSGQIAQQQNSRMYVLSVVAAVFLPLTFVTGLLGMNVGGLPGLENPMGCAVSIVIMIAAAVVLLLFFRWKRWL